MQIKNEKIQESRRLIPQLFTTLQKLVNSKKNQNLFKSFEHPHEYTRVPPQIPSPPKSASVYSNKVSRERTLTKTRLTLHIRQFQRLFLVHVLLLVNEELDHLNGRVQSTTRQVHPERWNPNVSQLSL